MPSTKAPPSPAAKAAVAPTAKAPVTVSVHGPGKASKIIPAPTFGALESAPNVSASLAAAEALSSGKSMDEAVDAAQTAAAGDAGGGQPPAGDAAPSEEEEREAMQRRRWLLALCHFGRGEFERLTTGELLDVAALVDQRALSFDDWRTRRGE
jgi:hypothetical protein